MTEKDILGLIEGRKVKGYKLDKGQRRELKFKVMQEVNEMEIKDLLASYLFANPSSGFHKK